MNDSRIGSNPFLKAAATIRSTGRVERAEIVGTDVATRPATRRGPKAILNYLPDDGEIARMVEAALSALSKGLRWDRGAILNVLV